MGFPEQVTSLRCVSRSRRFLGDSPVVRDSQRPHEEKLRKWFWSSKEARW